METIIYFGLIAHIFTTCRVLNFTALALRIQKCIDQLRITKISHTLKLCSMTRRWLHIWRRHIWWCENERYTYPMRSANRISSAAAAHVCIIIRPRRRRRVVPLRLTRHHTHQQNLFIIHAEMHEVWRRFKIFIITHTSMWYVSYVCLVYVDVVCVTHVSW